MSAHWAYWPPFFRKVKWAGWIPSRLINEALNKLPEREKKIIGARQLSENTVTLQELGKDLGISKERVRQLENRALNKLKLSLQKKVNKSDYLLTS